MSKKADMYNLVIDADRDHVLSILVTAVISGDREVAEKFARTMDSQGLTDCFIGLLEEFSHKNHDMGWCNDPECTYYEEYPEKKKPE